MKPGDIVKHKEFKDVACLLKSLNGNKAVVQWINLGQEKSWFIDTMQQEIEIKNPADWLICTDAEEHTCFRNATWKEENEKI